MKTKTLKISDIKKDWWIADADSKVLGRLASTVAQVLRGKHKVNFAPHMDNGDCVVVINAEKVMVTGNKESEKSYFRHTGYVGGVKTTNLSHMRNTYPERIIQNAVKGMLPHNKLGRRMLRHLKVYAGEMHRYIPMLAKWAGFGNITEQIVEHQSRKYGVTKFGMERFFNGFFDLLTITFISRFGKKPMHFFGIIGSLMFFLGFSLIAYIGGFKLYYIINNLPARNIAEMSGFYIALTCMIIGMQLFLSGFISEMISRNSRDRNNYQIESET